MKLFIFGPNLKVPQPVWMNIFWPHYSALSESVETVFLPMPNSNESKGRFRRRLENYSLRRTHVRALAERVRACLDKRGPNILLVYALNSSHVQFAGLLDDVWNHFDRHVLNVVDTLQVEHVPLGGFGRFELILSFCAELAGVYQRKIGVPTVFFPPHTDVLSYHSLREKRPLDLILVGRRDKARHDPLHRHFNAPERERIFLDFVTRTQSTPLPQEEFGLLMSTYSRAKAAFCYEPSSIDRFMGRSPLTGRWIHAWAAGCTVLGKAPKSPAVAELLDWPDATIDISENPETAIEQVEAVLSDAAGLERRRRRNVCEAMNRHDTRVRLDTLLKTLDLPRPQSLSEELGRLNRAAREICTNI